MAYRIEWGEEKNPRIRVDFPDDIALYRLLLTLSVSTTLKMRNLPAMINCQNRTDRSPLALEMEPPRYLIGAIRGNIHKGSDVP